MAQAKKKEPVDELGWTPTKYEVTNQPTDRGDSVSGLAETPEIEEAVAVEETPVENQESDDKAEVKEENTEDSTTEETVAETVEEPEKKTHMIPKDRLDQELAKRRQLENQLKELQKRVKTEDKKPKQIEFDFDKAEENYMNAVMDGKTGEAKQIRREIRQAERTQLENEFTEKMNSTVEEKTYQTQQQITLSQEVKKITAALPQLDVNSEKADQTLIDETNELMTAFIGQGYDSVDALQKAVKYTTNNVGLNSTGTPVIPGPSTAKRNTEADLKRKAEAAAKQPPKLGGESSRTAAQTPINPATITRDSFAKLSNDEIKKLRGDFG